MGESGELASYLPDHSGGGLRIKFLPADASCCMLGKSGLYGVGGHRHSVGRGMFGTWLIPRYSDKTGERRNVAALTLLAAGIGIGLSGLLSPVMAIVALCVAAIGFIAVQPVFWTMPTQLLSGTALAAGIGFVNLFGAVGGFIAPILRVKAETLFASDAAGLLTLAAVAVIGSLISFHSACKIALLRRPTWHIINRLRNTMNALLTNPFKERLRKGEVQIGLWLSSTTSYMAEIAAYFRL